MSTESFDPYHKWLGIRPEEQPANHYRLLALGLFEDDADAIANAADQRMLLVRNFQTGRASAVSQKLLNEITAARLCLLSPEKKAAYDEQLRKQLEPQTAPEQPAEDGAMGTVATPRGDILFPEIQADVGASPVAERSGPPPLLLAVGGLVALVLLAALIWIVARPGQADLKPTSIATRDVQEPVATHQRPAIPEPPPHRDRGEVALADATLADRSGGAGTPELPPGIDARQYAALQQTWAERLGLPIEHTNSIGMKFVLIPPGEFDMGSDSQQIEQLLQEARRHDAPETYIERISTEAPRHRVRITRPFYLGVHQVTQAEYERVVGDNPSEFTGDPRRPVENVNWPDAVEFCRRLGELASERSSNIAYRLPTEAEWEYACRAGSTTKCPFGDDASELGHYAWHAGNSDDQPHPVGQKKPNAWGLHDMLGNVWEWCSDWFHHDYYANSPVDDPPGPSSEKSRVVRGSSWNFRDWMCRSTHRVRYFPDRRSKDLGFRVAFTVVDVEEEPDAIAGPPHTDRPPDERIAKAQRQPVPASSEQQEVRRAIDELYDTTAPRKPEEALELAGKLAALAEKSKDGTERFVLLRRASELASDGGDARHMLEMVARIAEEFEVDRLLAQAAMLDGFAKKATRDEQIGALVEASETVIDQTMAAERFDLADSLTETVYRACLPTGGRAFRVEALARRREVQELCKQWEKVQAARTALESNPADEAAHTVVGRWSLLVQADWDRALPHLARGSEAELRKLAEQELNNPPEDPAAQVGLADAWWELAQTADADSRRAWLARAERWYGQAQPAVTSPIVQARVAQRLKELVGMELPTLKQAKRAPPPAFAPFDARQAERHQQAWAEHLGVPAVKTNSIGMQFVLIPPGEFDRGSTPQEVERLLQEAGDEYATDAYIGQLPTEAPQHRVRITRPFFLAAHETTQAEYERVMGTNPSRSQGDPQQPVAHVSWHDAMEFCRELSEREKRKYRLPTEAQWEYACRAGTTTRWHFGDDARQLSEYAWFKGHAGGRTHPVGRKKPNAWGLYDMHGNVREWCADWFDEAYYANSPKDDPPGPGTGPYTVIRGGDWYRTAGYCRSAFRAKRERSAREGSIGFRLVLVLAE